MESNFQKVVAFNQTFGAVCHDHPQPRIFLDQPEVVKLRLDLILEEFHELQEAVASQNLLEVTDALADILYVVYGAGSAFGLNLDRAFALVHESNMTKLCQTEEEARETIAWYREHEPRYDSPSYRLASDQKHWVVYNESTQKVLKSIKYQPVDLREVIDPPMGASGDRNQRLITEFVQTRKRSE